MLFFPTKYPTGDWHPKHLNFEDVYFPSEDGTQLHGWYCPAESSRASILIAHGNAGHVASRADWLACLQSRLRVNTFMFDYRGYGRSRGIPTVKRVLSDSRSARTTFCDLLALPGSEVMLMGESLGGAIAVQLAAESSPKALILQSTFSSLREIARLHYRWLSWFVPHSKLDSVAAIQHYSGPLLHSHGTHDRVIPQSDGRKLFDVAGEPKEFVPLRYRGHNDWQTETYIAHLEVFIDRVVSAQVSRERTDLGPL